MWQGLRSELYRKGLEIVTIALDTGGLDAARRFIEAASPEHPACIDQAHVVDELFGIVNVPSGVWIDEEGMIVRPPETAYPARPAFLDRPVPENLDPYRAAVLAEARKIRVEPEKYVAALRDWVNRGAESPYALPPDEVIRRPRARSRQASLAAAHFELGQYLHRTGAKEAAVPHFREAHRLQPDNWTYRRQAWSFVNRAQSPSAEYEGDFLSDIRTIGAENYYPPLEM